MPDLDITKLDYGFISGYALWLKTVRQCNHNSTMNTWPISRKLFCSALKMVGSVKILSLGLKLPAGS
ncbi:phage integrase SAM-like domain-containing protein [Ferruginibacter paludis]|uniref:phage integrase SAM-like domain-containing protein n=1 Tax=Ferruginibacter paludis TaxID=1310417 RepID=UPI0025B5F24B|nr:phage integrase SAM-like domain-containing protein [Ferruginibacter paludis]MDN3656153.1 phage integrase SAM-like domain-containing protein [Ferruginibacter paludis]